MIDFSSFIKSIGLTQIEFANRVGVAQSVISRINTGRENISASLRKKIIEEFGDKAVRYFDRIDQVSDPEGEYKPSHLSILSEQLRIKDTQLQDQADIIKALLNILQSKTLNK